ncbi:MAG: 1,4-alpha-glucan branching protein GlgB [Gemmatimonadota bacterium]|nr:1,4-alpha-glucan branching protein GlgB [Gemmatimonadota bacterium]
MTSRSPKSRPPRAAEPAPPTPPADELERLLRGEHWNPHALLGAHPARADGTDGVVVRALHPGAKGATCLLEGGQEVAMRPHGAGASSSSSGDASAGLFAAFLPGAGLPLRYRLRFAFPDGATYEREDPYRFLPTLGDVDLHLFNEGTHRRLWEVLGARPREMDGVAGVAFSVWAPNARRVSVVGDFCDWDGRRLPMRQMGSSGVWELFVPGVGKGDHYKYEILTPDGSLRLKTDPFALWMDVPPGTASRVHAPGHEWGDAEWMEARPGRDLHREPMAIYEVHLGSWARVPEEGDRPLTYREIAPRLVEHVKRLGFDWIELLPVAEHPFSGSWGYQVSGYYAPTSRHGTPDDFRFFVDHCHRNGVGVIVDWVPAHFPRDDFALRRFDGTALYEHEDPRLGEHPDWGTLIFNYGRAEVRNFLIANALYWLRELHVDGLRVDAVASMLYLDYSRRVGEWVPNAYGGRENLDAVQFLRDLNETIAREAPGAFTAAEESTAWGGVSRPVSEGGLGFAFKWNMGWMHDTLEYFSRDPVHRRWHHDELTFAMIYEYSERFIMPLSHDEVVHGKRSLLGKMPGDEWQRFANLRLLLAYQFTRPGKPLLFMGSELAPYEEWDHDRSLPWHLPDVDPQRAAHLRFVEALGAAYRSLPPLWRRDHEPGGYAWIEPGDRDNGVLSYLRFDGEHRVAVVLNLTPAPRDRYRIGVPGDGRWTERLNTDAPEFGGSGYATRRTVEAEEVPWHGQSWSVELTLPPLGALVLAPEG